MTGWLAQRGWSWFPHQIEALNAARAGSDAIIFAPTGAGKTLSGFLPSLIDLHENGSTGHLHTIYISPLKALAVDVHRNIGRPVEELKLFITYEVRSGDTPAAKRARQKTRPPDILMTTPESLALLTSYEEAASYFRHLKFIIVDELHAFLHSKRADLLSLNLERIAAFAPHARRIGLSATLPDPQLAAEWLCRANPAIITAPDSARPDIKILETEERIPWSGHGAGHTIPSLYPELCKAKMSVVFVNTRAQAEVMFQNLWKANEKNLKIGLHHGSLERELRRKVETKMAAGELDCVVATASLDLGLDWADVDLVVQIGAPKGVSRLLQRIGRSNHRLNEPSRAILVPTNRFEYLECLAALSEIDKKHLDGIAPKKGGLDVLAQHIFGVACAGPFRGADLYAEIKRAWPYRDLDKEMFYNAIAFVKDGGYALKTYERFSRLIETAPDHFNLRDRRDMRRYRMNIGTIVEAPMLKVKLKNKTLGVIEESFILNLSPGDTFLFGGEVLEYAGINNAFVMVRRTKEKQAQIPSYAGGKMPLSTQLSAAVRSLTGDTARWRDFPPQIRDWLEIQREKSALPDEKTLLVETFPRDKKFYMVAYSFAGWNANQTLGFLITRRMKRLGLRPLGFAGNDYALAVWSLDEVTNPRDIFTPELIYEDFDAWLHDTPLTRRLFRDAAVISGLIERRYPGEIKTGKQILFSTDLIYDVLMKYESDHILLRAAYEDARHGLIDSERVKDFLHEAERNLLHRPLQKISPMAVPVVLQIGRESVVRKDSDDTILEDMEEEILKEAGLDQLD